MTTPIRVGRVAAAFGIEGAVKVQPLTEAATRFAPGQELLVEGGARRVAWARHRPEGIVLKLEGVDDRNSAERLRGVYLEVPEGTSPGLPDGTWYHHQLAGLAVSTEGGRSLGPITDILSGPANDVWVVSAGASERLVPATRDAVVAVDLAAGTVTVADWLFEPEVRA